MRAETLATYEKTEEMVAHLQALETSGEWRADIKLDGKRAMMSVRGGKVVEFWPRESDTDLRPQFPEVVAAVEAAEWPDCTLDGELGYLDTTGLKMDWRHLMARPKTDAFRISLHAKRYPMTYCVFDVLSLNSESTLRKPFAERHALLASVANESPRVLMMEPTRDIADLYRRVVEAGGEGIMLKRLTGLYEPGKKSSAWQKAKGPMFLDNLSIVGVQVGEGARATSFGALILARQAADGQYDYVMRAGSGLDGAMLQRVMDAVPALRVDACPLRVTPVLEKEVLTWLRPGALTADVAFEEALRGKTMKRNPRVRCVTVVG